MRCVYCGEEASWLICNNCLIKTYEFQKSITQTFLDVSRTDEWRNELLEQHASEHIKELDIKIQSSGGKTK